MQELTWYTPWPWPVWDEPEDSLVTAEMFHRFDDWVEDNYRSCAIAYWDIPKAKSLGVWREDAATVLLFNWYPACSAIPWYGRPFYVAFKALEYRLRYSKRVVPCYLTLWTGKYHDAGKTTLTDEHGYTYWPSRFWNAWSWLAFRLALWPRETGKAYF